MLQIVDRRFSLKISNASIHEHINSAETSGLELRLCFPQNASQRRAFHNREEYWQLAEGCLTRDPGDRALLTLKGGLTLLAKNPLAARKYGSILVGTHQHGYYQLLWRSGKIWEIHDADRRSYSGFYAVIEESFLRRDSCNLAVAWS